MKGRIFGNVNLVTDSSVNKVGSPKLRLTSFDLFEAFNLIEFSHKSDYFLSPKIPFPTRYHQIQWLGSCYLILMTVRGIMMLTAMARDEAPIKSVCFEEGCP